MSNETNSPSWKRFLGVVGGMFLGAVLLVAAWAKVLDPSAFADQIRLEGLDFLLPATTVAFIALALEVGLGGLLLLGVRRLWVLIPSTALVAFFLWLTGRNYWLTSKGLREPGESCGCFGNLVDRTPAEAFWQDVFLLVPSLLLAFFAWRWGSRRPRFRIAAVAALTAAALVVAWKAPELPLDDLATRLKPGVVAEEVCVGDDEERVCLTTIVPELLNGRHVVVMADLESAELEAAVDGLNAFVLESPEPRLWVLSTATPEVQRGFFWKWGPSFEIRETPEALMKPLYRRLPRSFVVEGGEVVETFSGLPPLEELRTARVATAL